MFIKSKRGVQAIAAIFAAVVMSGHLQASENRLGLKLGFDVMAGWQTMGTAVDKNGNGVYSESAMPWNLNLFSVAWGFQTGRSYIEPAFYLGSGSGSVDNGKLAGIADAQFGNYNGSAYGGGLKTRFGLKDTLARFGLDFLYAQFKGESEFTVDGLPGLTAMHDAQTKHLDIQAVLEYDDPDYRPYLKLGIITTENIFESQVTPGNPVKMDTSSPFGARVGLDVLKLHRTNLNFNIELGYYSGPEFSIGLNYCF
jgi:hypothetical protein